MLRSKVNSLGNPYSETWMRKKKGWGREDLQKRKDLSLEWKSEWVMEYKYDNKYKYIVLLNVASCHGLMAFTPFLV